MKTLKAMRAENQRLVAKLERMDGQVETLLQQGRMLRLFKDRPGISVYHWHADGRSWHIGHGWTKDELRAALGRAVELNAGTWSHWIYVHGSRVMNFLFFNGLLARIVES